MTNFDPGGFLMLFTVIPTVVAGVISIGTALLVSRLDIADYDTAVVVVLTLLVVGWTGGAIVIGTGMLQILAVVLAMLGAFLVTQNVRAASVGWVLGVVLFFAAFVTISVIGIYQGVDQTGTPQDVISRNLRLFYHVGLLVFGAIGGKLTAIGFDQWRAVMDPEPAP